VNEMAMSQIRFCKKILGIFFFCDAVDIDIHKEQKNKITTNFAAKDRICYNAEMDKLSHYYFLCGVAICF
jgi:hypothetical protein